MQNEFKNKRILVTGGTGSIGSTIVKHLLQFDPLQVRVLSRDETKQFYLFHELGGDDRVRLLIGDIRDKDRVNLAMENIDIVFHTAALKHVLACEHNPFEAVKTNVNGTQNIIDCAFENDVDKVVGISTDKATEPTSVMGCTKLLAEKIMLASYFYKGGKKTKFSFVRFGNVLFSRGSVVPLFIDQIRAGGPVTVTDELMVRFIMSTAEAVKLIFKAMMMMRDREIFILKMPVVRIVDVARALINIYTPLLHKNPSDIALNIIGKKHGERIHEKLLSSEEADYALETDDMFIITPVIGIDGEDISVGYPLARKAAHGEYSTKNHPLMTVSQIEALLRKDQSVIAHINHIF